MNEIIIKGLKAFAVGVLGAVAFDIQKYQESLKNTEPGEPVPAFDWKLAVIRWVKGGATAIGGAFGIEAI